MEDPISTRVNSPSFSEIDYFFSSNLSETTWGIERLQQRIMLFDKSKRHILYLILIHMTLYNPELGLSDKKETLEKIVNELYKSQIKNAKRNPLIDFISPYFVFELLYDLFILGIQVKDLIKDLKINIAENPVFEIEKYGKFSRQGFPEAVVFFLKKLGDLRTYKDKHLLEVSVRALWAGNYPGFQFIVSNVKGKEARFHALSLLAVAHAERKEIQEAIKKVESIKDFREKCFAYSDITYTMLLTKLDNVVDELIVNSTIPEIKFVMVVNKAHKYLKFGDVGKANRAWEEAREIMPQFSDLYMATVGMAVLVHLEIKLEKFDQSEQDIWGVLFNIKHLLKEPETEKAYFYLIYRLALNNQIDKVREIVEDKYKGAAIPNEWDSAHNIIQDYQIIIDRLLNLIDWRIYQEGYNITPNKQVNIPIEYQSIMGVVSLIKEDGYIQESLLKVALNQVKNGFYNESKGILNKITDEYYRQKFSLAYPFYSLSNGNYQEAISQSKRVQDEKTRLELMLSLSPSLAKMGIYKESKEFIRNWANYTFQTL